MGDKLGPQNCLKQVKFFDRHGLGNKEIFERLEVAIKCLRGAIMRSGSLPKWQNK
jgi:hypothetical protein